MDAKLVEFNKIMQEECNMHDVEMLNFRKNFPKNDRGLWSLKDGLHFSEDKGIPILMCLIRRALADRPTAEKTPPTIRTPEINLNHAKGEFFVSPIFLH